ncbi:MAG: hypothetical protein ACREL5_10575 [Gemmatimonadales bacterium]
MRGGMNVGRPTKAALVRERIIRSRQVLLTARDRQDILQNALVEVRPGESDDTVCFDGDSATVDQICYCPEILLTCADPDSGSWIVLNGIAELPAWRPELPGWMRPGRRPALTEVAVRVMAADLWDQAARGFTEAEPAALPPIQGAG